MAKSRGRQQTNNRRRDRGKGAAGGGRRKPCNFCKDKIDVVDYKDFSGLRRAMSEKGKIRSARITGNSTVDLGQIPLPQPPKRAGLAVYKDVLALSIDNDKK